MIFRMFLYSLIMFFLSQSAFAQATHWQTLKPGLDYVQLALPENQGNHGELYAFRIDPRYYTLRLASAEAMGETMGSNVVSLAHFSNALIAVNGGFFSPEHDPLGLRMQDGQVLQPVRPISWWGVFSIRQGQARVSTWNAFVPDNQVSFAIQAGPRLLVKGHIPPLKPGTADRTALCIDAQQNILVIATANASLTTQAFAELLRTSEHKGGLSCVDALNLDGGTSTQLYAKVGDVDVNVPNFKAIADAVVVVPVAKT